MVEDVAAVKHKRRLAHGLEYPAQVEILELSAPHNAKSSVALLAVRASFFDAVGDSVRGREQELDLHSVMTTIACASSHAAYALSATLRRSSLYDPRSRRICSSRTCGS